mmetsp:Transcript_53911/g.107314  ORF Transcript_53911/g.107314 Transcript_53911/m.107314 type:complete len:88 (+) Transcript_53911:416-679(+)
MQTPPDQPSPSPEDSCRGPSVLCILVAWLVHASAVLVLEESLPLGLAPQAARGVGEGLRSSPPHFGLQVPVARTVSDARADGGATVL